MNIIDIYTRLLVSCLITPLSVFIFFGVGKKRNMFVYVICAFTMLLFTYLSVYHIIIKICMYIIGGVAFVILSILCFNRVKNAIINCGNMEGHCAGINAVESKSGLVIARKDSFKDIVKTYFPYYSMIFIFELIIFAAISIEKTQPIYSSCNITAVFCIIMSVTLIAVLLYQLITRKKVFLYGIIYIVFSTVSLFLDYQRIIFLKDVYWRIGTVISIVVGSIYIKTFGVISEKTGDGSVSRGKKNKNNE